jgi:hypothetical protein
MQPFERFYPRSILPPENFAGSAAAHPWTDMASARGYCWTVLTGSSDATGMILRPQQARDSSGTGVKDIPGKVVTVTDPGTDNRAHVIALLPEELDLAAGYRFARLRIEITGGTTVNMAAMLLACDARFGSAAEDKPADVLAPIY